MKDIVENYQLIKVLQKERDELEIERDRYKAALKEIRDETAEPGYPSHDVAQEAPEPTTEQPIVTCPGCQMVLYDQAAIDGWCTDCNPDQPCAHDKTKQCNCWVRLYNGVECPYPKPTGDDG